MPDLAEQTRIPAPLSAVWPLLSDPAAVASCIPGATLTPDQGDGLWRGAVKVRFGPTIATFRGEATLVFDHAAHRCTIEGRGIDQRGASRALSSGSVQASAEGQATLLDVQGGFTVTGPLETFANAGGVHVARALLAEFSANMAKLVAERGAVEAPSPRRAGLRRRLQHRPRRRRSPKLPNSAPPACCGAPCSPGSAACSPKEDLDHGRPETVRRTRPGLRRRGLRSAVHPDG